MKFYWGKYFIRLDKLEKVEISKNENKLIQEKTHIKVFKV